MAVTQKIVINFKGGIVSPGYLKTILEIAANAKVQKVRFGLRQELLLDLPANEMEFFDTACAEKEISFQYKKGTKPNIVSSYLAAENFSAESWLREGIYKDLFDLIDFEPRLKINICESTQQFVPLFTGQLNWISSPTPHFWYLYIQFPNKPNHFCWKELIYTNDIAIVTKCLEELILKGVHDEQYLFRQLKLSVVYHAKPIDQKLPLQNFSLPYYEGFNKSNNTYWLGIYRRDEFFSIPFLMDVCDICMHTKIGELYTTPWKSLIIKSIDRNDRLLWDTILNKHRINVRHAANELNWQVESDEGLTIKRLVIRHFDKEDVRTYGLCFAVHTKSSSNLFGSIIIQKEEAKNKGQLKLYDRYNILYKQDFNPNANETIRYREGVKKEYLGVYLVSLCKLYYEQMSLQNVLQRQEKTEMLEAEMPSKMIHQCKHCFTVYDETTGDEEQGVLPGTSFEELPQTYQCPVCDSNKEAFQPLNAKALQFV